MCHTFTFAQRKIWALLVSQRGASSAVAFHTTPRKNPETRLFPQMGAFVSLLLIASVSLVRPTSCMLIAPGIKKGVDEPEGYEEAAKKVKKMAITY